MRTVQEQPVPVDSTTGEKTLLTRPFPAWLNESNLLWTLASLAAVLAGLYLLVARPVQIKTWQADQLTTAVEQKNDYQLYPLETDPAGQLYHWTYPSKALFVAPITTHNNHQLKITIRARGASAAGGPVKATTVTANEVVIGQFTPAAGKVEFQDFSFSFTPAYRDDNLLRLTFDTPAWKPKTDNRQLGFALQSVTVDLQEIWSPLQKPSRIWLIWLLPGLALVVVVAKVAQRRTFKSGQVRSLLGYLATSCCLGIAVLMSFFLLALFRLGYNGLINQTFYWAYSICSIYLAVFALWVALVGLSLNSQTGLTLWQMLDQRSRSWRAAHPVWLAAAVIFLFNLILTLVFAAKVIMENGSPAPIFRYLDGPEYILIAHGFYDRQDALLQIIDFGQHSTYYWGAHFPLFPLALMTVQPLVGWLWSPLVVNFLASTGFAFVFYRLVRDFNYTQHPLWLALIALVLPVRWLIYHNVGSSEPIFMLFEVLSIYFFKKERYWLAGIAGVGAVFSRPPGIFLWFGLMLCLLFEAALKSWNESRFSLPDLLKRFNWRAFGPLLLLPLGLLGVFGVYGWRYGDFLAYFKITENVTHVGWLPFPTMLRGDDFNSPAVIYTYILCAVGLVVLWRQRRFDLFWVGLAAYLYTLFLLHSDVLRYSIPFFALIVLIPFANLLSGKVARYLSLPVIVALFFYSWGQLVRNLAGLDTFDAMRDILQIIIK